MRPFMQKRNLIFLALLAVIAIAAPVTANSVKNVDRAQSVDATDASSAGVTTASAEQIALMGSLQSAKTAEDKVPTNLVDWHARGVGAQPDASRLLSRTDTGDRVFALPARKGICIASDSYLFNSCVENSAIADETTLQAVVCSPYKEAGELVAYGVFPDAVEQLTAAFADGSSREIILENNFAVIAFAKSGPALKSITWIDSSGKARSDSPFPANAAKEECDTSLTPSEASAWARKNGSKPPS